MMNKRKVESKFEAINNAICYWLGYQHKIGREKLIHEASLRYPIADVLTGQGTEINKIQLEKCHPYFVDRPVDLFVYNKPTNDVEDENLVDSIAEMYELKLAKNTTNTEFGNENQRIIDDILRLAFLNKGSGNSCYFVICGTYENFKTYFIGDKNKPTIDKKNRAILNLNKDDKEPNKWNTQRSLYKDYFEFHINGTKTYEFKITPEAPNYSKSELKDLSKDEIKEYKKAKFGLTDFSRRYETKADTISIDPITVQTTCLGITAFEGTSHRTHAGGIWKIESV